MHQASQLNKVKQALTKKLDETKMALDAESQSRSKMATELRTVQDELIKVKDQLEDEEQSQVELKRLLTKSNAELSQMQQRCDNQAAGAAIQELEDVKRKMNLRIQDATSALEAAQAKASSAEKAKARMQVEIDTQSIELEKVYFHSYNI